MNHILCIYWAGCTCMGDGEGVIRKIKCLNGKYNVIKCLVVQNNRLQLFLKIFK